MEINAQIQEMVLCKMIKPRAFRRLDTCKKCQYYGGIQTTFPGKAAVEPHERNPKGEKEIPPMYEVLCALPTRIFVETLMMENNNATSQS